MDEDALLVWLRPSGRVKCENLARDQRADKGVFELAH